MKFPDKLNNKGFVLAETLIVTVAVAAIFTITFTYFYPLIGEYEKRENYDDLDSKYGTYWIKKLIESSTYPTINIDNNKGYALFDCDNITDEIKKTSCKKMMKSLEVNCDKNNTDEHIDICYEDGAKPHIYITTFTLNDFRNKIKNNNDLTQNLKDYIDYLPNYDHSGVNKYGSNYRIIVEYYRHRFDTQYETEGKTYQLDTQNDFYTYSEIEVKK